MLKFFLVSVLVVVCGTRAAGQSGPPVIFRAMDPVGPGETALLAGDWNPAGVGVRLRCLPDTRWQTLPVIQPSDQSLKVTIPKNWTTGIYACQVEQSGKRSATVYLNAPDAWWLLGDAGAESVTPGGWLRLFGKALYFKKASHIRLQNGPRIFLLSTKPGKEEGGFSLAADIPTALIQGTYAVSVHNGYGGPLGWRPAGRLTVKALTKRPDAVFKVPDFFKGQPNESSDWTAAAEQALAKAGASGGGIVYFPQGRYQLNAALLIPRGVTLRGEGMALTSLYWPQRDTALRSLITGTDDFAIQDLSLYTHGVHRDIIAGDNNVAVRRVRIRADAYFRHDGIGNAHAVKPVSISSREMGAGIRISGDNAVITDCDIYHSASALELYHTRGGLIARNRLDYGKGPMQLYGLSKIVIEDNVCSGASLWASGNGISLYGYSAASYHIYFAHNTMRQVYGGDREAMTLDGHGTAYFGKVENASGSHIKLESESWWGNAHKDLIQPAELARGLEARRIKGEEWHGITLFILAGRGAGQYRNVISVSGKHIEVESPWNVAPDSSSVVSIGKFQGRMLFIGNRFYDAGTSVQLYPPNFDCIVAGNQSWRAQSMNAGSDISQRTFEKNGETLTSVRVEPSWYNQFLNNHFWEGNGWGGTSAVLSLSARGQVKDPAKPWALELPMSRGQVIRGNRLDNNVRILVTGAVADAVIEYNRIAQNPQGIVVQAAGTVPQRLWISENQFNRVAQPIIKP